MKQSKNNRWIVVILLIAVALLAACGGPTEEATEVDAAEVVVEAGEFNRVVLTEKAAQRLGVETAPIHEEQMDGTERLVVPYAAVIYGLNGETWVYSNIEPLTFRRESITVDYIEGDIAVLLDGPPAGTEVVTVAVAELYGADTGVGQ
jgi:hypothetical protein